MTLSGLSGLQIAGICVAYSISAASLWWFGWFRLVIPILRAVRRDGKAFWLLPYPFRFRLGLVIVFLPPLLFTAAWIGLR